jgi:hypothetical protein
MKVVICLFACLSLALALPQREGAAFTNDAIKQAQSSHLIPAGAAIENVSFLSFLSLDCQLTISFHHLRCKKELNSLPTKTFPEDRESTWPKSWALKFHKKSSQTSKDKSMVLAGTKHLHQS